MAINTNINQFEQGAVRGQLDLNIIRNGILSCVVGANQSATVSIKAGDRVKFDTGYSGSIPQVVAALATDASIGVAVYDVKQSGFNIGDKIGIAFFGGNMAQYHSMHATLNPGDLCEMDSNGLIIAHTAGKVFGTVLDPAVDTSIGRVILAAGVAAN